MISEQILEKVVAFILRERNGRQEILVFDHPTAGTQIPAGTVEEGESLEAAVLRETKEETGFTGSIVRPLASPTFDPLGADRVIALKKVTLRQNPAPDADPIPSLWSGGRGMPFNRVEAKAPQNRFIYVARREIDHNQTPPKLIQEFQCWSPAKLVTRQQRRHYFQIRLHENDTPEQWIIEGDYQHHWRLYWTPLEPRPQLMGWQNDWLAHVWDTLRDS